MAKLLQYVTYRGKGGHWAWILHRLTGLGVLFFLLIHILDISLIGWGPRVFDSLLIIYRGRVFRCMEVLLAGAVIYHALNGIRIIIVDFWPAATTVHRKLVYAVALIFVVVYVPTAVLMLNGLVK